VADVSGLSWRDRIPGQCLTALKNKLYFGDNVDILRDYVDDEVVGLIYLDELIIA
jgi:hypothetical protein